MRLLFVLLVGLLVACSDAAEAPTGETPGPPTAESPQSLRFATVNLLHGRDSDVYASTLLDRLGLVADALRQEEVDIVGVQEASITSYAGSAAEELAGLLGFEYVYQRANPNIETATAEENEELVAALDFEEGSAIISRFPIRDSESIDLARLSPVENRIALRASLDTPLGDIDVYVTHLTNVKEDPEINVNQARSLADWVNSRPSELPALLMGDFNALEGSPTIDLLTERYVDVYRAADPEGPGYTCCQDDLLEPEPMEERKRIDYLFLISGEAFAGEVVEARVFLDAPLSLPDGRDVWASDHFGLLAVVRLVPPAAESP